jgi:hypothetical protein
MFNTDITLAGDSSSTRTYALRSITGGNSIRANASAPSGEAETLTLKHSSSRNGNGLTTERHLVRLDLQKVTSLGLAANLAVYAVIEVPQDAVITVAMVKDMRTQLANFLVNANVDKLLNDEP